MLEEEGEWTFFFKGGGELKYYTQMKSGIYKKFRQWGGEVPDWNSISHVQFEFHYSDLVSLTFLIVRV